jgi:hypothetical protein
MAASQAALRRQCMQHYQQAPPVDNETVNRMLFLMNLGDHKEIVAARMKVRNSNPRLQGVPIPFDQVLSIVQQCAKLQAEQMETAELCDAWHALGGGDTHEAMSATSVVEFISGFGLNGGMVLDSAIRSNTATMRGSPALMRRATMARSKSFAVTRNHAAEEGEGTATSSPATSVSNVVERGTGSDAFLFSDLQELVGGPTLVDDASEHPQVGGARSGEGIHSAEGTNAAAGDDFDAGGAASKVVGSLLVHTMIRRYLSRFRKRRSQRLKDEHDEAELQRYRLKYFPDHAVIAEHHRLLKSPNVKSKLPPLLGAVEAFDRVVAEQDRHEKRKQVQKRLKVLQGINQTLARSKNRHIRRCTLSIQRTNLAGLRGARYIF